MSSRAVKVVPVSGNEAEADTDIIAIHGLDTCSPDTWTWKPKDAKSSVNWLSDAEMLPSRVGKARILTCDWPADMLRPKDMSQKTVKEYARLLLDGIQRERAEHDDRPIIFIASCLGGIILIQALVMAGSGYSSICQSTRGIVFLATPFRGTSFQDIAPWAEPSLSIWASARGQAVTVLTKNTKRSSDLGELVRQFTKLVMDREKDSDLEPNLKIQIITFYEQQTTQLLRKFFPCLPPKLFSKRKLLVDGDSANLDIVEHPISLDRPHVLMNKFNGPGDPEHEKVAGKIQEFLQNSRKNPLLDSADAFIKENCENKLTIERLSGESLRMDQCYINLAVVEQQRKKDGKKAENSAGGDAESRPSPFSLHHRLNVDTPDEEIQVVLSTIFEERKDHDGITKTPRRILIRGRAGVGKTTLCKKMVYDFIHGHVWQPLFDRVLWVPLRRLKGWESASYTFEELFCREMFRNCEDTTRGRYAKSLHKALDKGRTLFVLDGLDELSLAWAKDHNGYDFLRDLMNQKNVVITTRPYFTIPDGVNAMDLELETIGFYPEQVKNYVDKTFGDSGAQRQKAEDVHEFLDTHPLIQGLARIPIQLDALCFNWGGSIGLESRPETMTAMYQAIENGLWKKDALRLEKIRTENDLQSASSETMERLLEGEIRFLEGLAFSGLYNDMIEFEPLLSSKILNRIDDPRKDHLPDKILPCLSFLRTSDPPDPTSGSQQSCHFLHLTYQEYFAARYFVRKWKSGEDLEFLKIGIKDRSRRRVLDKNTKTTAFLHEYKYDARYDIMWRFVAGLLDSYDGDADEQDTLRFFQTIDEEPLDLLGPAHQRLIMHCLSEVSQDMSARRKLEETLLLWLSLEVRLGAPLLAHELEFPEKALKTAALEVGSNRRQIMGLLLYRRTIPASIIELATSWLVDGHREDDAYLILSNPFTKLPDITLQAMVPRLEGEDHKARLSTIRIFKRNSPLSEKFIPKIRARLQDRPKIASTAKDVLLAQLGISTETMGYRKSQSKNTALSEVKVQKITALLEDDESYVRSAAAKALAARPALLEEVIQKMAALLQDDDRNVRYAAVKALAARPALSEDVNQRMAALLQDNDSDVRGAAVEALAARPALLEEVVQKMAALLEDDDWDVRSAAVEALAARPTLSEKVVQKVAALLQDDDWNVRSAAVKVLAARPTLSEKVVQKMAALLQDDESYVRGAVVKAIAARPALSEEVNQRMAALLEDDDWDVRSAAVEALAARPALLEEVVQKMAALLEDDDSCVRSAAVKALAARPALLEEVVQKMAALLQDDDWDVRSAAVEALAARPTLSEKVIQNITALLEDDDRNVRSAAVKVLAARPTLSEEVVQKMAALLEDDDSYVRSAAVKALAQSPKQMLSKSVLEAAALTLRPGIPFQKRMPEAERVLRRHREFYSTLFNDCFLRGLYEVLLQSSFHEQISWYIRDGRSYLSTPEGLVVAGIDDEQKFRALINEARPSGHPLKQGGIVISNDDDSDDED